MGEPLEADFSSNVNHDESFEEDRQDILVHEEDALVIDALPTVSSPNLGAKHLTTDLESRIIECVSNGESLSAIGAKIGKDHGTVGRFVK
jgi:hypothetical protein